LFGISKSLPTKGRKRYVLVIPDQGLNRSGSTWLPSSPRDENEEGLNTTTFTPENQQLET